MPEAKGFRETVNFQPINFDVGADELANTIANSLEPLKELGLKKLEEKAKKRGKKRAGEVEFTKGEGGFIEAPALLDEGFIGLHEAKAFNESARDAYIAAQSTDSRESINRIKNNNINNVEGFKEGFKKYRDSLSAAVDPAVRNEILQNIDNNGADALTLVQANEHRKIHAKNGADILNEYINSSDKGAELMRPGGNDLAAEEERFKATKSIDSLENGSYVNPEKAIQLRESLKVRMTSQKHIGRVNRIAERESIDAAFIELDRLKKQPTIDDLNPEQSDTLRRSISANLVGKQTEAQRKKTQIKINGQKEYSDLLIGTKNGSIEPGEGTAKADELFERGVISGVQRAAVHNSFIADQNSQRKTLASFEAVANRMAGDKTKAVTQKQVNDYYDGPFQLQLTDIQDPDSFDGQTEWNAKNAQFVEDTGKVPKGLTNEIISRLPDPNKTAQIADFVQRVDQMIGVKKDFITGETRAAIDFMVANKHDPDAASKLNVFLEPANRALKEQRVEEWKKIETSRSTIPGIDLDDDIARDLESLIDPGFFFGTFSIGADMDEVTQSKLHKELKETTKAQFLSLSNYGDARTTAKRLVGANWDFTETNGVKRYTDYPAEKFYHIPGQEDSTWIGRSAAQWVADEAGGPSVFVSSFEDIILVSNDKTAREAVDGNPAYLVYVRQPDGSVDVMDQRWRPGRRDIANEMARLEKKKRKRDTAILTSQEVANELVTPSFTPEEIDIMRGGPLTPDEAAQESVDRTGGRRRTIVEKPLAQAAATLNKAANNLSLANVEELEKTKVAVDKAIKAIKESPKDRRKEITGGDISKAFLEEDINIQREAPGILDFGDLLTEKVSDSEFVEIIDSATSKEKATFLEILDTASDHTEVLSRVRNETPGIGKALLQEDF